MISFQCPACGKQFTVDDKYAGKKTKCTNCGQKMLIPLPTGVKVNYPPSQPPVRGAAPEPFDFEITSQPVNQPEPLVLHIPEKQSRRDFFGHLGCGFSGCVIGALSVPILGIGAIVYWFRSKSTATTRAARCPVCGESFRMTVPRGTNPMLDFSPQACPQCGFRSTKNTFLD